jgi:platelet-activating factor acetylhydrolase IB subunit beta/gamma
MTPTKHPGRLLLDMKTLFAVFVCVASLSAQALDYPYAPYNEGKMDPQKSGWPLTEEERKFVLLPEHERRPGREINQHKPSMWPVTPSAGFWGGTSWLETHANLVKVAQASQGPIDVLLVGDSITMQWGAAWTKHFPTLKTVNIGIGGDKTQNVLWRLDHGGVEGLEPRLCVLLIGNNNMFFTPETGIGPAAQGIKVCVDNLREKFPKAPVVVVKVFPAHTPGNPFYEDIKKVNAAMDNLNLEADPKVRILDIWGDMVNADGTLKKELFTSDNIHLNQEGGYKLYAEKLKPLLEAFLAGKEVPKSTPRSYPASAPVPSPTSDAKPAASAQPTQISAEPARAKQIIYDETLASGWINNPIQSEVTVDNNSPVYAGTKSIKVVSSAYGALQLLRWGTSLDTTRYKSLSFRINGGSIGGQNLRLAMMNGQAEGRRWQVVPVPEANAWTKFSISLADLGVANTRNLYGLRLWEAGGADSTYYVDNIQITDEEVPSLDGVVFDDIFRGFWFNNAFAADVVATNATPVNGGVRSLAVTITAGGGCAQISHGGAFPDTSPYDSLSFWIHGGPEGGQKLHLFVKRWNEDVPVWTIPVLKPNEWAKHTVPLSVLGAANSKSVAAIWFRDADTGSAQPTFYLDDIKFEASVNKPAGTAIAAPGGEASTATTTKAAPAASPAPAATLGTPVIAPTEAMLKPTPRTSDGQGLVYPYAPYNEGKMDPQLTGWPLTDAEKVWVAKSEYTRKPGHEVQKHLPEMWFVTPTAARWGKDGEENAWVAHHATCVQKVRAMKDGIDIALLGDSITQGWGGGWDGAPFNVAWQKHFGGLKTVNLGIGGDRIESILWRLDHGALDGASPKVIVLKIGVNNAPLVFANGAPAASAAHGIKLCIENLRMRCPKAQIVLVKILPAFDPSKEAGKAVVDINNALDALRLERDPQAHVLDLWGDFTNADGTLKTALYSDGHLHLGPAGYEGFASKLKSLVEELLK